MNYLRTARVSGLVLAAVHKGECPAAQRQPRGTVEWLESHIELNKCGLLLRLFICDKEGNC